MSQHQNVNQIGGAQQTAIQTPFLTNHKEIFFLAFWSERWLILDSN